MLMLKETQILHAERSLNITTLFISLFFQLLVISSYISRLQIRYFCSNTSAFLLFLSGISKSGPSYLATVSQSILALCPSAAYDQILVVVKSVAVLFIMGHSPC